MSPVPKPLDSQKDASAGEHFFISMAASKKKIKDFNIQVMYRLGRQYTKQMDAAIQTTFSEEVLRVAQSVFIAHLV